MQIQCFVLSIAVPVYRQVFLECNKVHIRESRQPIHTRLTMYYIKALIYDFLSGFLYVLVLEALRSVLETLRKYTHVHSKNV